MGMHWREKAQICDVIEAVADVSPARRERKQNTNRQHI